MITGNIVRRLNSETTPNQPPAQPEGKEDDLFRTKNPVRTKNPDVTANDQPQQTNLPGTVNRPPYTGPVEEQPPQQKRTHSHWPNIDQL